MIHTSSINTAPVDADRRAILESLREIGHRKPTLKSIARQLLLRASGAQDRLTDDTGLLLTFDDGPDPDVTPAVLELLAEFSTKAIFFVVGSRIARAPHMLSRILAEGHLIGNHTYDHPLEKSPTFFDYYRDIERCQKTVADLTGIRPSMFRPPLGSMTPGSLLAPRLIGLRTLFWSLESKDWTLRETEAAVEVGRRLSAVARQGDIVLLHDDNPCVVPLLRAFLPRLAERKCRLITGQQLKTQLDSN